MDSNEFVIRSSREAEAFQFRLSQYRKRRCGRDDLLSSGYMRDLFSYADREGATKLFAAVYDLEITFLLMEVAICSAAGTHNLQFACPFHLFHRASQRRLGSPARTSFLSQWIL